MKNKIFIILGDQLFNPQILKDHGCNEIFMAEDFGLCTDVKHHKLKLYLFLCAMREYKDELIANGIKVNYFSLVERKRNDSYINFLLRFLKKNKIKKINFFEIDNKIFENDISIILKKNKVSFKTYQSPMFIFSREEFISFHKNKKIFIMANFYQFSRKKFNILLDENNKPLGGKWSFDDENRRKIPASTSIPELLKFNKSKYHNEILNLINKYFKNHPGNLKNIWFPTNRKNADLHFEYFLKSKLASFGSYEDAMINGKNFLFHSCISALMNIGLLSPSSIINRTISFAKNNAVPLNSLEGFIRQVIGWREFIRGIYQLKGSHQKDQNFWNHQKKLSKSWYEGTTGILPLDDSIQSTIKDGYNHHIPRLMVIANIMNLCEIDPIEIYKWFMEMNIDSSEWVMVPNVFGMATFADGGLMSTKPYTCGSNYLLKMSNYKKDDWCETLDGLYWRFTQKNKKYYQSNPRLTFILKILDRMKPERKKVIFSKAEDFISKNTI